MVKSKIILLFVISGLLCSSLAAQSSRGPSTQSERDTAVKAARLLESDPLNKDAKKLRAWFVQWLIEIPDITVIACTSYMPHKDKENEFEAELFVQMMFSGAAFIIEHPEQSNDRIAVDLAGLEGALQAYQAILRTKPKAKWVILDDLVAKRDTGQLKEYVEEISQTKCTSKTQ
jgi:hypothetical protein